MEKTGIGKGFLVVVNETVAAIGLFRLGNELEVEDIYVAEERGMDRLRWSVWSMMETMVASSLLGFSASPSPPETAGASLSSASDRESSTPETAQTSKACSLHSSRYNATHLFAPPALFVLQRILSHNDIQIRTVCTHCVHNNGSTYPTLHYQDCVNKRTYGLITLS